MLACPSGNSPSSVTSTHGPPTPVHRLPGPKPGGAGEPAARPSAASPGGPSPLVDVPGALDRPPPSAAHALASLGFVSGSSPAGDVRHAGSRASPAHVPPHAPVARLGSGADVVEPPAPHPDTPTPEEALGHLPHLREVASAPAAMPPSSQIARASEYQAFNMFKPIGFFP